MSEHPRPASTQLTDEQMRAFYADADVILTAEQRLGSAVADLVQAPFNAEAQQAMAAYLGSEELQRATDAARRTGGVS